MNEVQIPVEALINRFQQELAAMTQRAIVAEAMLAQYQEAAHQNTEPVLTD